MKRFFLWFLLIAAVSASAFQSSFLKPDEAFKPKAVLTDSRHVRVDIALGEGIYVYEDSIAVKVLEPKRGVDASFRVERKAEMHDGDKVYTDDVPVDIAFTSTREGKVPVKIEVDYQGCSSKGLCYEPQSKTYDFILDFSQPPAQPESIAGKRQTPAADAAAAKPQTADVSSETDLIVDTLKGGSIWAVLALFFGFGLALSLTPCIFPMIPILSSIIVSQGENITMRRGFTLSLVYVLSIALAYTFAGIAAGLFGENIQVLLQNPWVIAGFALVFVALAFSMFGFYEIGLPASLQTKLSRASDEAGKKGGFAGVAVMGFLSALIVGPCVAPGLAAALIYIGQTGNAALGGAALFVMSLGMGVPLILIGIGAGRFMPKPGGWMNIVTEVFGAVMIGIAIWMMSRVLPDWMSLMVWGIYFIVSAVYLGAFEPLKDGKRRSWQSFVKAIGIVFALYGTLLFVGALSGGTSLTHPLKGFEVNVCNQTAGAAESHTLAFTVIHSEEELDRLLRANRGKKVMLDFSAQWCSACKEYKEVTFSDPAVVTALKGFVLVQADVTDNTPEEKALTKKFGLFGPPGIVFFDENGRPMASKTLVGYKPPKAFLQHLHAL